MPLTGAISPRYVTHTASPAGQRRRCQISNAVSASTPAALAKIGPAVESNPAAIWYMGATSIGISVFQT